MPRTLAHLALAVALALAAAAPACSKKSRDGATSRRARKDRAKADAARAAAADPIWALAPEDAVFGLVVGEGVPERTIALAAAAVKIARRHPVGEKLFVELQAQARHAPFDPLDPGAWKQAGFDLTKSAALFVRRSGRPVLVMPAGDVAALRRTMRAEPTTASGVEVDRWDNAFCVVAADRYVCGDGLEDLEAVAPRKAGALARAAKAMAGDHRGDVEVLVLAREIDEEGWKEFLAEIEPGVRDVEHLWISARVDASGVTARAWLKGRPGPMGEPFLATKPPAELRVTRGATGVTRMRVDPRLFLRDAPPRIPVGSVDLRKDLLEQFTGDVLLVTGDRGFMSGAVVALVEDGARVQKAIEAVCPFVDPGAEALVDVEYADGACRASLSVVPVPIEMTARGKLLVVAGGGWTLDAARGSAADVAGSDEAVEILTGPATFAAWGRGFDLMAMWTPELRPLLRDVPPDILEVLDFVSWLGLHVYELGFAAGLHGDGARALLRVTTFGEDPAAARAAYDAALERRLAGDEDGWKAALAGVARQHRGSLAGRQGALVTGGAPPFGIGTSALAAASIPAFLKHVRKSKTSEAVAGVRRIDEGARTAYLETGKLPPSAGPTPPVGSCCGQPGDRCAPAADLWATEGWGMLGFAMADPHYYSYEYESDGQRFTARAVGDLDCDGVYSTFEIVGEIRPDGTIGGGAGIYREQELE